MRHLTDDQMNVLSAIRAMAEIVQHGIACPWDCTFPFEGICDDCEFLLKLDHSRTCTFLYVGKQSKLFLENHGLAAAEPEIPEGRRILDL